MAKPTKKSGAPRKLGSATLMHFTCQLEAGRVNANIQQDVSIGGASERHGRDVNIAIDDLGADIRKAIDALAEKIADHVDASPYTAEG